MKTLANGFRAAKDGKVEKVGQTKKPQTEIDTEFSRVGRELAKVKIERDLLNKFATYFAK
jgi:transposase